MSCFFEGIKNKDTINPITADNPISSSILYLTKGMTTNKEANASIKDTNPKLIKPRKLSL